MAGPIALIEAEGTPYEVGLQIGRRMGERVRALADAVPRARTENAGILKRYAAYLAHVKPYPTVMDELRGLADGAELPFDVVARIQFVELDRPLPDADGCTTLIVRDGERTLIGHNEDGGKENDVFVLKASYASGLRVLALCYVGSLPGHAPFVNSHGLLSTCNALRPSDFRIGEPKRSFCRRVMEARGIDDAISILRSSTRAQGENWVFRQAGRIVDVETSATALQVRDITANAYHCNNYLFEEMVQFEAQPPSSNTYTRSREAQSVCGGLRSLDDLRTALCSHANEPNCFCRHPNTLGCVLFDCAEKRILIGHGPTCRAELREFSVDWPW